MIGQCIHGKLRNIMPYRSSMLLHVACDFRCQKHEEKPTLIPSPSSNNISVEKRNRYKDRKLNK